jgi:chemotaxis protein MotB
MSVGGGGGLMRSREGKDQDNPDIDEGRTKESVSVPPVALRRKKMSAEKGEGLWLMSFSDMSLILMSFFVLQLAMSAPDKRKTDQLTDAVRPQDRKGSLQHISENLLREITHRQLGHLTEVSMDMNGLSIEFKDQAVFSPGSARPEAESLRTFEQILEIVQMASGNYQLFFEGHTDDLPIKGGKFRSNWELSGARSLALLEEFKRRGVSEERMGIRSFAHTRPKVKVDGLTGNSLKLARSANRRVVIRLE